MLSHVIGKCGIVQMQDVSGPELALLRVQHASWHGQPFLLLGWTRLNSPVQGPGIADSFVSLPSGKQEPHMVDDDQYASDSNSVGSFDVASGLDGACKRSDLPDQDLGESTLQTSNMDTLPDSPNESTGTSSRFGASKGSVQLHEGNNAGGNDEPQPPTPSISGTDGHRLLAPEKGGALD